MLKTALQLCSAVLVVIGTSKAASPQESLKGITQVHVVVERLVSAPAPLTQEQLRTDIALKLREAGITVLPDGTGDLTAYVYVRVGTSEPTGVFTVDLAFKQLTRLERERSSGLYYATTWDTGSFGMAHSAREIRDRVGDQVDRLVDAWLAANPK